MRSLCSVICLPIIHCLPRPPAPTPHATFSDPSLQPQDWAALPSTLFSFCIYCACGGKKRKKARRPRLRVHQSFPPEEPLFQCFKKCWKKILQEGTKKGGKKCQCLKKESSLIESESTFASSWMSEGVIGDWLQIMNNYIKVGALLVRVCVWLAVGVCACHWLCVCSCILTGAEVCALSCVSLWVLCVSVTVCGRINVYRVCFEWGTASWCYLKFPISALTPLAITVAGDKHKVKIIKYPRLGQLLDLFHVTVTPTPPFFYEECF